MKKILLYPMSLFVFLTTTFSKQPYFTYGLSGGRLGDNLMSYAQCKHLSCKYKTSMLARPFKHYHLLHFSTDDTILTDTLARQFKQIKRIKDENKLHHISIDNLYNLSYFIKMDGDILEIVWKNPDFQSILKTAWQPKLPLKKLNLPNNTITIAVHVRKGSGKDDPLFSEQTYPSNFNNNLINPIIPSKETRKKYSDRGGNLLKFPPEQYYIDQLILLSELLDNPKLYVYLFTDSNNPKELAQRLEKNINKNNITIDYRKKTKDNRANNISSILEDFYDMAQFDIIIRANSNLSKAAQLIGDHLAGIYPHTFYWDNNRLIINSSHIIIRDRENTVVNVYKLPTEKERAKTDIKELFPVLEKI